MKFHRQISTIIIALFIFLNLFILIPSNSVAPPAPRPDQFIAELFPNSTLPLQLSHTNVIISFNATDLSKKIDIDFDAKYSIFNPENATSIPIILPLSLATNISNFIFEVYVNNTQVPFDLLSITPWNENITEIDVHLAFFVEKLILTPLFKFLKYRGIGVIATAFFSQPKLLYISLRLFWICFTFKIFRLKR